MNEPASPLRLEPPSLRRPHECVVEHWLGHLGHRWTALVLWQLGAAPQRHEALQRKLPGISPKVLTERLNALCELGLVRREEGKTFPRAVTYHRTPRGDGLAGILDQIEIWGRTEKSGLDPGGALATAVLPAGVV